MNCSSIVNHPNIIFALGLREDGIVMEYAEYGTLRNVLLGMKLLDINKYRVKLCLDVARGMEYLHNLDPPIIHRDLKTSNILVCKVDNRTAPIAKVFLFFSSLSLIPD